MGRPAPTCGRCGGQHYNFQACDQVAAKPAAVPDRFYRPRDGERDWATKTHTTIAHGQNVVFIPRKKHPLYTPPSRGEVA